MGKTRVDYCVEAICHKGCLQVRRDILLLERGEQPEEVAELSSRERMQVLQELKNIMAVYGDICRIG